MMGAMFGGGLMGMAGMMSFMAELFMRLLGPMMGAMAQMFGLAATQ